MLTGETPIEMARRHVREGEAHVAKQHALIARLRDHALPTDVAEQLLAAFEAGLADHRASVARMEAEQQTGRRDVDGNLAPLRH
jgi:hypothetical protein